MASSRSVREGLKKEQKKEPLDISSIDLMTIKDSAQLNFESFSNVEIDEESQRLLIIASQQKVPTRFAVVDIFTEQKGKIIHNLVFQPSLPANATEADMKSTEELYGKGNVVKAHEELSGIVHPQTIAIRGKQIKKKQAEGKPLEGYELKLLRQKEILDERAKANKTKTTLPSPLPSLGLSCQLFPTKDGCRFDWIGRSTMQYTVFKVNDIAQDCFLFNEYSKVNENNLFVGREYTTSCHIDRSVECKTMDMLHEAAKKNIEALFNRKGILKKVQSCISIRKKDSSVVYDQIWQEIRNDKAKIAAYLENSLYVAIGLASGHQGRLWPDQTDYEMIERIFKTADKLDIKLNLNSIPKKFTQLKLGSPLLLIIKNDKPDQHKIFNLLRERGAELSAEDMAIIEDNPKIKDNYFYKTAQQPDNLNELILPPLHLAAKMGDLNACRKFLPNLDPNQPLSPTNGVTPFFIAAENNQTQVLKGFVIINKKAGKMDSPVKIKLNRLINGNWTIETALYNLMHAHDIITQDMKREMFLSKLGSKTPTGLTPLHIAVLFNQEKIVKQLLQEGANVNAKIGNKITPLELAVEMGHFDIAYSLIEKQQVDIKKTADSSLENLKTDAYSNMIHLYKLAQQGRSHDIDIKEEFKTLVAFNRLTENPTSGRNDMQAFYKKYNDSPSLRGRKVVLENLKMEVKKQNALKQQSAPKQLSISPDSLFNKGSLRTTTANIIQPNAIDASSVPRKK
jgi:hypothetical protein